jgi:hypothetical protein
MGVINLSAGSHTFLTERVTAFPPGEDRYRAGLLDHVLAARGPWRCMSDHHDTMLISCASISTLPAHSVIKALATSVLIIDHPK